MNEPAGNLKEIDRLPTKPHNDDCGGTRHQWELGTRHKPSQPLASRKTGQKTAINSRKPPPQTTLRLLLHDDT